MPMDHKDFEALASMIASQINRENGYPGLVQRPFTYGQINDIMDFCKERNADFDRKRFSDHITARVSKDSPVASAMVLEKRRAKTRDVQGTVEPHQVGHNVGTPQEQDPMNRFGLVREDWPEGFTTKRV